MLIFKRKGNGSDKAEEKKCRSNDNLSRLKELTEMLTKFPVAVPPESEHPVMLSNREIQCLE